MNNKPMIENLKKLQKALEEMSVEDFVILVGNEPTADYEENAYTFVERLISSEMEYKNNVK